MSAWPIRRTRRSFAFQVERVGRRQPRQHLVAGHWNLAGEERFPVSGHAWVSRLGEDLGRGEAGRLV
jgi:hypothetical protein